MKLGAPIEILHSDLGGRMVKLGATQWQSRLIVSTAVNAKIADSDFANLTQKVFDN